jgi:hypothetical protein
MTVATATKTTETKQEIRAALLEVEAAASTIARVRGADNLSRIGSLLLQAGVNETKGVLPLVRNLFPEDSARDQDTSRAELGKRALRFRQGLEAYSAAAKASVPNILASIDKIGDVASSATGEWRPGARLIEGKLQSPKPVPAGTADLSKVLADLSTQVTNLERASALDASEKKAILAIAKRLAAVAAK